MRKEINQLQSGISLEVLTVQQSDIVSPSSSEIEAAAAGLGEGSTNAVVKYQLSEPTLGLLGAFAERWDRDQKGTGISFSELATNVKLLSTEVPSELASYFVKTLEKRYGFDPKSDEVTSLFMTLQGIVRDLAGIFEFFDKSAAILCTIPPYYLEPRSLENQAVRRFHFDPQLGYEEYFALITLSGQNGTNFLHEQHPGYSEAYQLCHKLENLEEKIERLSCQNGSTASAIEALWKLRNEMVADLDQVAIGFQTTRVGELLLGRFDSGANAYNKFPLIHQGPQNEKLRTLFAIKGLRLKEKS